MEVRSLVLSLMVMLTGCFMGKAQDMLVTTKVSQRASVTQRIGTTDVTVVYSSPVALHVSFQQIDSRAIVS